MTSTLVALYLGAVSALIGLSLYQRKFNLIHEISMLEFCGNQLCIVMHSGAMLATGVPVSY